MSCLDLDVTEQVHADGGPQVGIGNGEVVDDTGLATGVIDGRCGHELSNNEASESAASHRDPEDHSVIGDHSGEEGSLPVNGVGRGPPEDRLVSRVLSAAGLSQRENALKVGVACGSDH